MSGITLDFQTSDRRYDCEVNNSVTSVTVAATPTASTGATVRIMPADGDQASPGHQVSLDAQETSIIILVQADDGSGSTAYYVDVTRGT